MLHIFRFVNTVLHSKLDKQIIWNHLKKMRSDYLVNNAGGTCKNFIPEQNIINNLEKLSQILEVKHDDDDGPQFSENENGINGARSFYPVFPVYKNFSKTDIDDCAKMFIFLNSCPSFHIRLYREVINGPESRMALLSSNIIKKSKDDFKIKAKKIFAMMSSMLGFQHISYHYDRNESEGNIEITRNILDIKSEFFFIFFCFFV